MIEGATTALDSLEELLGDARGRGLVSVTTPIDIADPSAAVFAARLAGDRWFCWEEPDDGFALAGVGSASEVVSRGPERFGERCARVRRAPA